MKITTAKVEAVINAVATRAAMMAELPVLAARAGGDGRGRYTTTPVGKQRRYRQLLASRWTRDTAAWAAGWTAWNESVS